MIYVASMRDTCGLMHISDVSQTLFGDSITTGDGEHMSFVLATPVCGLAKPILHVVTTATNTSYYVKDADSSEQVDLEDASVSIEPFR